MTPSGSGLRVDLVSIFPAYFDVLDLSLAGKARTQGLLDVRVHDLRSFTHDRHRTVDDSPYGGGAGMVMKPEPWGEAIDSVLADGPEGRTVLVVPTPSGVPFTQDAAADLAGADRIVVACGRYEGIDQRVIDHYASLEQVEVREVSLGDYVLNGGEVAALAVVEAVARLLPGFMGNAASLSEESHGDAGLLEYPVYTKPASWRGHDVPAVLLSGDHARIAAWRHAQAVRRTAQRRPDLLPPSHDVPALDGADPGTAEWRPAVRADAGEVLTLQRACWMDEAQANDALDIPPLQESYDEVVAGLTTYTTWVLRVAGRLVGSVRAHSEPDGTWFVGRLMVAPDLRGHGLGRWMLERIEELAPPEAPGFALITGAGSEANLRRYRRAGYRPDRPDRPADDPRAVRLAKRRR
ncbi:tRNA (guanosine(37)-N1)-methyltransferase TrmD [Nocardioides sp. HDW12B]|nr:tRNA (guanosine(37)-N1)-methyltransferase TrmD [Nocardioides sp. HDW12B]